MRSLLTLAIAGLIAATTLAPASAASHHKRVVAPQPTENATPWQTSPVSAHPNLPPVVNDQPNACFTDEGYGRFASCDQAGG